MRQSDNVVDVLEMHNLSKVGRLAGLGRGERIYAIRFAGPLAYMVTFREIDPLYTISLRDPTNPYVHGELKIPGYSDYLHPIDNSTIFGFGRAGDAGARICSHR